MFDAATYRPVGTIETRYVGYLTMAADGSKLFSAGYRGAGVAIIDLATNQILASVPLGGAPNRGALSEDGRKYYTGTTAGDIVVIDTQTYAVLKTIHLGGNVQLVATKPAE